MSDFKFGLKIKAKTVGEFNVGNPGEWSLLIKPQIKDDTLFVHFHCQWKRKLTDAEIADGIVAPPGILTIVTGFLKDGKFIPVSKNNITSLITERLIISYERYIREYMELGYIKHSEMYLGSENPSEPIYYENSNQGKIPMDIRTVMNSIGAGAIVPIGIANHPPKNPHIILKSPTKIKGNNNP